MRSTGISPRSRTVAAIALALGLLTPRAGAQSTARATAPLDLEGNWVSVVTEDWRWRMLTPPKGDAPGIPLNAEGLRVTNAWDLARDNATGNQCKAYGAAGLMRIPTRLRIGWQDDMTLTIESDAGEQTRLIRFHDGPVAPQASGPPTRQGFSIGTWQLRDTGAPLLAAPRERAGAGRRVKGSLKVVTTNLLAGYTRKNGVPYSEHTVLTEYFDRHEDFGAEWFTVLTIVDDPTYYVSPFVTTTHFEREPDGSKWKPRPCETMPPTTTRVARGAEG
jgi:hypothetical protein